MVGDARALPDAPTWRGLPVIGHTVGFATGRINATLTVYRKVGEVGWMNAFGRDWLTATGPDAAGSVLQDRDRAYAASGWSSLIGPFFKRGLMLLDGDEHHRHRRIMQEAFTADRLHGYLGPINDTVAAGLDGWTPGRTRFYPAIKQLTLDVATRTFMAAGTGDEGDALNRAFVDCVRAGTALVRAPVPGGRWWRGLRGRQLLEQHLRPQVGPKRAGEGTDLFSALCHARGDDGEAFTDDDIVNHMIFLLMAAHDTATITLTTMAYELARHPEWQERCRAESDALGTDRVGYDDLDRLTSLDLVMKECLRMVTPVPSLVRAITKDADLGGFRARAGTYASVNLWGTHHLPQYWPEPDVFDPGRFADDRREDKVHRHAFLPFGSGVHKCIGMHFGGMEVKAVAHQLLRRYRLTVDPGYRMPLDWTSLPRPRDGLPLTLHRR